MACAAARCATRQQHICVTNGVTCDGPVCKQTASPLGLTPCHACTALCMAANLLPCKSEYRMLTAAGASTAAVAAWAVADVEGQQPHCTTLIAANHLQAQKRAVVCLWVNRHQQEPTSAEE